jgi:rare lipoprotein A
VGRASVVLVVGLAAGCGGDGDAPLVAGLAAIAAPRPGAATSPAPPEVVLQVLRGRAIWYGDRWQGRRTASGERFDKRALTAAHRGLPLGSRVRVTNLRNDRQVIVRITDRGPYGRDRGRIIDLSERAAEDLGFKDRGWTDVRLEVLAPPAVAQGGPTH